MNRKEWMDAVLREIRFAPDRRKIRQELMEHMEDRMEEYMEWDTVDETEAEVRVLESMGDPSEVGRDLNRQHKPWLGWLWLGSWAAVVVSLCLVVLTLGIVALDRFIDENSLFKVIDIEEKYAAKAKYYDESYNYGGDIYYNLQTDHMVQLLNTEITFRNMAYDDSDGRLVMLITSRGDADLQNIILDIHCNGEAPTIAERDCGSDNDGKIVGMYVLTFERFGREAETLHVTYDKFGITFAFHVDVRTGAVS